MLDPRYRIVMENITIHKFTSRDEKLLQLNYHYRKWPTPSQICYISINNDKQIVNCVHGIGLQYMLRAMISRGWCVGGVMMI